MDTPIIESKFVRWACALCGLALTAISVSLTAAFGASISTNTAFAVGIISFLVGVSPTILLSLHYYAPHSTLIKYARNAGLALMCVAVPFDVITNASTSAVDRTRDLTQAKFETVNSVLIEKQIKATTADVATWKQNVEDLKTRNAWAASATFDAKRAEVEKLEALAKAEGSKARGGCGKLCRQYEAQAAAERAKLPVLEQRKDYTARIEAAERKLASLRAQLKATPPKVSAANEQNRRLASIVTASSTPSSIVMFIVDNIVSIIVGLLITMFGMFFTTVGFLSSQKLTDLVHGKSAPEPLSRSTAVTPLQPAPVARETRSAIEIVRLSDLMTSNRVAV